MQPHIGDQVYIRPCGQVLDSHGREVPTTGQTVAWSEFWQCRLQQGDVVLSQDQAAPAIAVQAAEGQDHFHPDEEKQP